MEENPENPVEISNEQPVVKTEEEIAAENRAKYEAVKKIIEEQRLPLNESTSTDTIQRIRTLIELLSLRITAPKYTEKFVNKKPVYEITGSYELTMFPFYGETDQDKQYIQSCHNLFVNRIIDLAKTL